MIIVNQDNTRIVNFDNVEILGINVENLTQIACSFNDGKMILAEYQTEERAKEVLKQIIGKYQEYATIQNGVGSVAGVAILPKVYEMPKE